MGKLSHQLLDMGFLPVLGTIDVGSYVGLGTPNTWDTQGGITAVYDEMGRPWIILTNRMSNDVLDMLQLRELRHGANVPHIKDGGRFVQEVLVKLMGKGPAAKAS